LPALAEETKLPNEQKPAWRKSSYSTHENDFVEVADTPEGIAIRRSSQPGGKTLLFTRDEIAAFIAGCKAGEFDDIK
jgi:hypothetical protein